ncbi:MAG: purine-nucleoside phosphorylase [Culicoidibacterales bacterium]
MAQTYFQQVQAAVAHIQQNITEQPTIGLVLGSGLGSLADQIEDKIVLPYETIPYFPQSTVVGHAGNLVVGKLEGKTVIALQGRVHFYEGISMQTATFAIRVMQLLGVKQLIVTNAAGGINTTFEPGTLMLITDHINLMGTSPLIGENIAEFGTRFPDMTYAYAPALRAVAKTVATKLAIPVREGVYVGFTGPAYETPAEVRFARIIGGDAAGMSTVPEVIVANHANMQVVGISCITNMAAGVIDAALDHSEVMEVANRVHNQFVQLVRGLIAQMPTNYEVN